MWKDEKDSTTRKEECIISACRYRRPPRRLPLENDRFGLYKFPKSEK
jgi:hypothetical protein